nr:MAG: Nucleoside 2-deoxyribosyltransferase like protein [Bacteriophage sp.]
MLRVFISQPMNGKTDKEIEERLSIVSKISETVDDPFEVIDE